MGNLILFPEFNYCEDIDIYASLQYSVFGSFQKISAEVYLGYMVFLPPTMLKGTES